MTVMHRKLRNQAATQNFASSQPFLRSIENASMNLGNRREFSLHYFGYRCRSETLQSAWLPLFWRVPRDRVLASGETLLSQQLSAAGRRQELGVTRASPETKPKQRDFSVQMANPLRHLPIQIFVALRLTNMWSLEPHVSDTLGSIFYRDS